MRAVLVQNMRNLAKYVLKYAACGIYAAYMWHYGNMWRKWRMRVCLRWTKCAEMLKNTITYAEICDYMRIFANLCINKYSKCINKYSKFWKRHYMRENMRYAHFFKKCDTLRSHDRYKPVSLSKTADTKLRVLDDGRMKRLWQRQTGVIWWEDGRAGCTWIRIVLLIAMFTQVLDSHQPAIEPPTMQSLESSASRLQVTAPIHNNRKQTNNGAINLCHLCQRQGRDATIQSHKLVILM